MDPMLSWKVIESQSYVSVFNQALCGLVVLGLIGFDKPVEGLIGIGFSLSSINLPEVFLGL